MISSLLVTMAGVFAAATLRGFTGFGFGLVAVPLLSLALLPAQVVPLVVTLQVAIGLTGLRGAWKACDWRAIGLLAPGLVVGVPLGLLILTGFRPNSVRLAIGLIIAFSVCLIYRGLRLPPNPSRLLGFGVGMGSGVISGLSSMGGPPVVVFFLALGLPAARVRATAIVYFMLSGCVVSVPMATKGLITRDTLIWAAASLPAMLAGARLGAWAFSRSKPRLHRMVALMTLSVLAMLLIGRSLFG